MAKWIFLFLSSSTRCDLLYIIIPLNSYKLLTYGVFLQKEWVKNDLVTSSMYVSELPILVFFCKHI